MEEKIKKIMSALNCSRAEALQLMKDDEDINKGKKKDFDLSPEAEKEAKKWKNVGTKEPKKGKTERKRKENPTKAKIIAEINAFLCEKGYEMVKITNAERQIAFKVGENDFELTLVQKRKEK